MVFSRESGLFVSSPRSEKHTLHAILNAFAFVSILFGIGAVYLVLFHIDHINTYRDAYLQKLWQMLQCPALSVQGSRIRFALGCVIPRAGTVARSRNLGQALFGSPVQGDSSARRPVWVDLDMSCPGLLGMMGIWQKRLCSWARWGNTKIKVNPKIIA